MRKSFAEQLQAAAERVAVTFSNPDRPGNAINETFSVDKITVLSEISGAVVFHKMPTEKKAVAFFYFVRSGAGRWQYFFVTYPHLVGLERIRDILFHVEQHNFSQVPPVIFEDVEF